MKKLSTILGQQDEETVKAIQEERRHFEEELREYSGEDPLVPWYTYIQVMSPSEQLVFVQIRLIPKWFKVKLLMPFPCSGLNRPTPRGVRRARFMSSSRNVSRSSRCKHLFAFSRFDPSCPGPQGRSE